MKDTITVIDTTDEFIDFTDSDPDSPGQGKVMTLAKGTRRLYRKGTPDAICILSEENLATMFGPEWRTLRTEVPRTPEPEKDMTVARSSRSEDVRVHEGEVYEMNDTHGAAGKGWYGFDLDGTLAKYDKWEGIDRIGEPVKPMVDLINRLHEEGKVVKILTARVAPRANVETKPNPYFNELPDGFKLDVPHVLGEEARFWCQNRYHEGEWDAKMFIVDWCVIHLGFIPEITHEKDHLMLVLFDDRVKQVIPNEGLLVEDLYIDLGKKAKQMYADNGWLVAKVESKKNGFWAGFMLCVLMTFLVQIGFDVYNRYFVEKTPDQVRMKQAHDALCDLLREWPVDWTLGNEVNTNGVYSLEVR